MTEDERPDGKRTDGARAEGRIRGGEPGDRGRRPGQLLSELAAAIRVRHYSPRTEEAYRGWVVRFVRFHDMQHPDELGARDVNHFLTHLAVELECSASTQAQARAALLFLYRHVLGMPLDSDSETADGDAVVKART